jgi:hypothetical protein
MAKTPVLKIKDMKGETGKIPVLKVAKQDQDLRTAEDSEMALNSLLFLPKVYAVKKMSPVIPEGYISGEYFYEHGLEYPPMYLYYEQQQYFRNNEGDIEFDPVRFIYGSQGRFDHMDSTEFRNEFSNTLDAYLILFQDSLSSEDRDYSIDSRFQTLKVHMQGQFVCNLPEYNAPAPYNEGWVRDDWFSFNHNLGFPPVHTPFVNTVGLSLDLAYENNIPTDFVVNSVNDMMAERWAYDFGWYSEYPEVLWIYVDKDKYYVGYRRQNWGSSEHTFPARKIRVNYTIFNLPINEEFNLLS